MYEVDEYTVSLLHFEDGVKDETGKVWTFGGGAAVSNSQKKYGKCSLFLDASKGSYISTPDSPDFDFQNGDFTIELNVFFNSLPTGAVSSPKYNTGFCGKRHSYDSNGSFNLHYCGNKTIQFAQNCNTGGVSEWCSAVLDPKIGQWYHVAIVRKQNTMMFFLDGKKISSSTFTQPMKRTSEILTIGAMNYAGIPDAFFDGYIDEFRISKIARWTEDFDLNAQTNKALLVVTMSDEIQKEYELSMGEINSFITWYDNRAAGSGLSHYIFNKDFNLGPFQSRKDYLVFDKIQNFEVKEYTK